MLLLCEHSARAAVLLVLQTCKSGLALLLPQSLAGEPDVEAVAAKPQEDSSGCRHLSCKSSMFGHKAMSSLLVKMALVGCCLEAMALVLPQVVNSPLPSPVGVFRVGASPKKMGPPGDFGGSRPAACWSLRSARWSHSLLRKGQPTSAGGLKFQKLSNTQLGAHGGGCDHLYCSHVKGSERKDEGR
jgi:hypothetical protein